MAMNKIERIDKEIAKTREKITEYHRQSGYGSLFARHARP